MTKEDRVFVDEIATKVLLEYIRHQKPTSFEESVQVARVSYKQALAMLKVKTEQLNGIIEEVFPKHSSKSYNPEEDEEF